MRSCLPELLNGLTGSELKRFALFMLFVWPIVGAIGALKPAKSDSKSVFDIAEKIKISLIL